MRVSMAKAFVEEQELLIRRATSNPWCMFYQDVLSLKDARGNNVYSNYGDSRASVVAWKSLPNRLRSLLGDVGPARWLVHPFSRYSVHFFLRAFEIGKMEGNFLMELQKEKLYTRKKEKLYTRKKEKLYTRKNRQRVW